MSSSFATNSIGLIKAFPAPYPPFEKYPDEMELQDLFSEVELTTLGLTFHGARESNMNLSAFDRFLSLTGEQVMKKEMTRDGFLEIAVRARPTWHNMVLRHKAYGERLKHSIAYLSARWTRCAPSWMRTVWWTCGLFDPIPTTEEIAGTRAILEKRLAEAVAPK